jgi:CIC family chloride channel protein
VLTPDDKTRPFGWLRSRIPLLRLYALRAELRFAPTESQRLFILTVIIGIMCGFAAVGFHFAIAAGESLLIGPAMAASGRSWMLWGSLSPALGGLVSGILLKFVVPGARGSGIPQVKVAYATRGGAIKLRDAVGKFFLGALQIGSGGSLGREGPTVQICAGVASALGRVGRISPQNRHRLIPVGAAAGIAAAFNAPIAAVTFTIEEIVGKLDQTVLSGVIVAAALAAVIERSVLGTHPVFDVPLGMGLQDARSLVLYAGLGVAAAVASVAFTDGLLMVRRNFRKLRVVPDWAQPAVGGLVTGVLAVAVLALLNTGGVTGGGYAVLKESLSGHLSVKVMLVLCVVKIVATVFSYSSGGAGGIFAPSLFIGAMVGGAFGSLDRTLFAHPDATVGAFALVGMGAVFSGTIRAPMTSVLIIVEMTSGYGLILPLMIANMSAYILAQRWRPEPIYEALLAQDGIHLRDRTVLDSLEAMKLDSLIQREQAHVRFDPAARAAELLQLSGASIGQHVFPVVDAEGRLLGLITTEEIAMLRNAPELELVVNASDLMRSPVNVRVGDDLRTAFELMRAEGLRELPIVDDAGFLVGLVAEADIAQAYLRASGPKSVRHVTHDEP